jgi:PAS domain S-box-containing protein
VISHPPDGRPLDPESPRAWRDLFDSLQTAYAELTEEHLASRRRTAEVEETRDRFEQVIESMSDALFLLDRSGTITRVNRAALMLVGRAQEETVGQNFSSLWPNAQLPSTPAALLERAPSGVLTVFDAEVTFHPRVTTYVSVSCALVRDKWGKITGVLIVAHDTTERKLAEDALAFLAEASNALVESLSVEAVLDRVAHLAVPRLADACLAYVRDDDPRRRQASACADRVSPAVLDRMAQIIDGGPTAGLGGPTGEGVAGWVSVPLGSKGKPLGVLSLLRWEPARPFDARDAALAEELARRAALAVENAQLYEREHNIAETLQRSFLPRELPVIPGIGLAARYLPARPQAVGGDWYDVLQLPQGLIGLAMGDVAGRGVRAAAVMGRLRETLRVWAMEGYRPAAVAERLCRLMDRSEMATLAYAVFDPATSMVQYVSAGHVPPLVIEPGGSTAFLERGSPPLASRTGRYAEAAAHLPAGGTLLLYTDGLVDLRGQRLDDNLARLAQIAAANCAEPVESLLDRIVEGMAANPSIDDVALLALRAIPLDAPVLRVRMPAAAESLAVIRRSLRRWLSDSNGGFHDQGVIADMLVACTEACGNAIEHAYGPAGGEIEVAVSRVDEEITIIVRDWGRWRAPRGVRRGRGLEFMRRLMDSVSIERRADGSTVTMRRRLREAKPDETGAGGSQDRRTRGRIDGPDHRGD